MPTKDDTPLSDKAESTGSGLAQVATRISRWTSNLLLTAVIVLIALLLGGHLTELWKPAPPATAPGPSPLALWDDRTAPLQLQFGDSSHTMTRRTVGGDRQQALDQLGDACAASARQAAPRTSSITKAERDLLTRLGKTAAIRTIDSEIDIYQLDAALPALVGVRRGPSGAGPDTSGDSETGGRVVTWGLVAPGLKGGWNLFTFSPAWPADERSATVPSERLGRIPTPPSADRLLSIRSADGAAILAFRGTEAPEPWAQFYDDWLAARDFRPLASWQMSGHRWSARYRRNDSSGVEIIDIQLHRNGLAPKATEDETKWYGIVTQSYTEAEGT